jgi:MFS transporter, DHA2 family, multidrug resistance protein
VNSQNQLQGFQLYVLLTAIALTAFLISLDGFIVNVAIPTISGELGVPADVGAWVITLFSMSSTVFVPVSGYLSFRIGNFHLFIMALIFFMLSSLLAGLAEHFSMLLLCRVFQGASAGLLTPVSLALIINNFPESKKNIAIGFWSFFVMVGPAMGPMIGGWLSDYRWHWMFFLNIPICLFSLASVLILLPEDHPAKKVKSWDLMGMVLLFTWVGCIQSATNRWNIDDWFRSPFITTLFVIAAISLIVFILWELFHPFPFIDLKRLKNRNFALPSLTTGLGMGLLFSSFVLDSIWVQEVLGYTPAWAGLSLSPVGVFPLIFYPLIGRFVSYLDLRIWVIMSFILYACTFFWLSNITIYTAFWQLALPRLIQGIGFAFFTVPNAMLTVRGISRDRLTSVISFFSFVRMLFVGFMIALAITLRIFRETFYQSRLVERTFYNSPIFNEFVAPYEKLTDALQKSYALSYETLTDTASTLALADIYYLYAWIFLGLCVIVLFYKTRNS